MDYFYLLKKINNTELNQMKCYKIRFSKTQEYKKQYLK